MTSPQRARRWTRRAATATAAARIALGACALARPQLPLRPWVGRVAAGSAPVHMLGHALGGRDLALGAGVLAARSAEARRLWLLMSAMADLTDAVVTAGHWSSLPRAGRVSVITAAAGSAVIGVAGAVAA